MYLRFNKPWSCYSPGQVICFGKRRDMGGGVANVLIQRKIATIVLDEPKVMEDRDEPRTDRAVKRFAKRA